MHYQLNIRTLLPLFLLLLCCGTLTAQELTAISGLSRMDYVITINNDTIRGKVEDTPSEVVLLQIAGKRKPRAYHPEDIKKCYTVTGDTYIPAFLPEFQELDFVKILEHGKIQLYEHYDYNPGTGKGLKVLYAIKKNLKLAVVSREGKPAHTGNKKNLLKLIGDRPELVKLCEAETELSVSVVRNIVKKYNSGN